MLRPSMVAQQSDGPADPTTVTDTAPRPVLVVVASPALRMAVTVVVDVKVSTPWTLRPAEAHVKVTPDTPEPVVAE